MHNTTHSENRGLKSVKSFSEFADIFDSSGVPKEVMANFFNRKTMRLWNGTVLQKIIEFLYKTLQKSAKRASKIPFKINVF